VAAIFSVRPFSVDEKTTPDLPKLALIGHWRYFPELAPSARKSRL